MSRKDPDDGFTSFFIAYRPKLAALIARFHPGSRDEVDDVLQDVWIKGAKAWPPREIAFARAWLGRIAINEAIGRGRRTRRSPVFFGAREDALAADRADTAPRPDELAMLRQMRDRLHCAVDRLEKRSPRQAAVMRLVCIKGHSYAEAASILEIAEGTAKSQTFKAIENLRLSLTDPKAA